MSKNNLLYEIFANVQVTITDGSFAGASAVIGGSLTIDWEQYTRGKSLLECCALSRSSDPYECNFPLLTNICLPTAEEYAAWDAEQAAASGDGG